MSRHLRARIEKLEKIFPPEPSGLPVDGIPLPRGKVPEHGWWRLNVIDANGGLTYILGRRDHMQRQYQALWEAKKTANVTSDESGAAVESIELVGMNDNVHRSPFKVVFELDFIRSFSLGREG